MRNSIENKRANDAWTFSIEDIKAGMIRGPEILRIKSVKEELISRDAKKFEEIVAKTISALHDQPNNSQNPLVNRKTEN